MGRLTTSVAGPAVVAVPGHPMAASTSELAHWLEWLPTCMFVVEPINGDDWTLVAMNRNYRTRLDVSTDVLNVPFKERFGDEMAAILAANYIEAGRRRAQIMFLISLTFEVGPEWWRCSLLPVFDEEGQLKRCIGSTVPVTPEQQERERLANENERLATLTQIDPLTELGNRRAFFGAMEGAAKALAEQQIGFVCAIIDIDKFKLINDRFGHTVGDDALVVVGKALRSATDDNDTVARIGGDEFGIITTRQTHGAVKAKLAAFLDSLEAMGKELGIPDLSGSCGIAPGKAGEPVHLTFTRADRALYVAKDEGSGLVKTAP